jgi:hypothetical protein
MALDFENALSSLATLDFWFKVTGGEALTLADVPEIVRLRWEYFRDNWEFIKQRYIDQIPKYSDPQLLKAHIDSFSEFVTSQRTTKSKKNPFDNNVIVARFFAIFDNTLVNTIQLTFEEQQIIDNKVRTTRAYTRGDFLNIREKLEMERDQIADKVNTADADYNRVFNRSSQAGRVQVKNKDLNKMLQLQEAIKAVNFILANSFSLESSVIDPFALARQNAKNPNIDIRTYSSGYLTKLNYNEDLQSLAKRTLGDPNKWIDIAITNGLKPPYVDEVGQKLSLISNASGNQINIAEFDNDNAFNVDKFYVGQIVLLQSSTQTFPEQRSILNINQVPVSGEIILELDGEADLDRYKISEGAHIRIYKPNTVNSSFYVVIPSLDNVDEGAKTETPWFLQGADGIEKKQKVDLLLNDKGDLDFGPTSDLQLAYGLTNSIQAIKLKLGVESGELRRHPDFGLIPVMGLQNNDISAVRQVLTDSITSMISADPRFAGVDQLDVTYADTRNSNTASSVSVYLVVRLAGSGQLLPITFSVNT